MNEIHLRVFCFPITLKCNLRCKLCGANSPYYASPYHPSIDDLFDQLDALFRLVSYIDKFDIGGGEPFLRDDLASIIANIRLRYRSQIGRIRIITNGTMYPMDDQKHNVCFMEEARKWGEDFYIIIDKYSVRQDISGKIHLLLCREKIPHEVRDYANDLHCGGWVDFGDFSRKCDGEGAKKLFQKCSVPRQGFFTSIVDGKLFPCGRARILYEKGIGKDYVDLRDRTLSDKLKKQKFLDMLGAEYLETCGYCNGMCDDSERFLPAEQLSAKGK